MIKLTMMVMALVLFTGQANAGKRFLLQEDPDRNIRESVFKVLPVMDGNSVGGAGGTGFLLKAADGRKLIITNKHICDSNPVGGIFLLLQGERGYVATNPVKSSFTDLCALTPTSNLFEGREGIEEASSGAVKDDSFRVFGHPMLRPLTITEGTVMGYEKIDPHDNTLAVITMLSGFANIVVLPGNSGSPAVNNQGKLIGVVFAYQHVEEGEAPIGMFIPLISVQKFLKEELK